MNANKIFLPIGTLITSIHGESNSTGHGEIHTGPNAEGFIESIQSDQETCYRIAFQKSGVAILLTEAEVTDTTQYTIGRSFDEGEVVGLALNHEFKQLDLVVQWDGALHQCYCSGESVADFGAYNLREHEAVRVGMTGEELKAAVHQHKVDQYEAKLADVRYRLEREDIATIVAALRYYQQEGQGDPDNRDSMIQDLATAGGEITSRDDDGIDALCEQLNCCSDVVCLNKPVLAA